MAEKTSEESVEESASDDVEERVEIEDPEKVLELNDKYRRENKGLRDRLKGTEEELAELRKQAMSEQERAIEEAKQEARQEVETEYRAKLFEMKVRARAANVLNDPDDAFRLIDFVDVDLDDDDAIDDAIKLLVDEKPYLARQEQPSPEPNRRNRLSIDQGPQGGGSSHPSGNDWIRTVTGNRR